MISLSEKSRPAVAATLPVVGENIDEIAKRFYGHMFTARPDLYQTGYENLMWAIGDVLGDAVTPEVAAAWSEAHWLMAFALTNTERGLYSARGVRPRLYGATGRSPRGSPRPRTS